MSGTQGHPPRRVSTRGGSTPPPSSAPTRRGPGGGAQPRTSTRAQNFATPAPSSSSKKGAKTNRAIDPELKGRARRRAIRREYGFFNYPRNQYTGWRRWVPSWRFVFGAGLFIVLLGIGGLVWAYQAMEIPQAEQFATAQKTTIYYSDGKTVMGEFGSQDRVIVDIATLPEHVGQVFVAAEDRTFYENQGISIPGMTRALINNVTGGSRQGGSTITQQYAERYYLGETKSYTGKLREAILAVKLAQHQDKDEILGNYINTIYLGRGAYGIQSAALKYFGVDAADLTVEQAAMIAGILPSPTNWDPRYNEEKAEQRWNYVLDGMVTLGWLSSGERAGMQFPDVIEYERSDTFAGTRGYLLEMARSELITSVGLTEEEIDTRGLEVVTTIDRKMQRNMVQTVRNMPEDTPKRLRPALVTIDPDTGGIRALYGGKNYLKQQYNNVTQGMAQAGSTFKPFTLMAALEEEISPTTEYFNGNNSRTIEGFERPVVNFGGSSYGYVNLMRATGLSVNTAYAELNVQIGPDKTMEAAVRAGIPQDTVGLNDLPSNVLGTASVHPLDLANAYATIASGGIHREAHIIESVRELLDGTQVFTTDTSGERVFEEDIASITTQALAGVVEWGTGQGAQAVGRPAAGKTGTSSENKSAWFAGYTPNLVTVVGMYQVGKDGSESSIEPFGGYREITGGSVPLDMWTSYMTEALADLPEVELPEMPSGTAPPPADDEEEDEEANEEEEEDEEPQPDMVAVPRGLIGATESAARSSLRQRGLSASVTLEYSDTVANGIVIAVTPGAGTEVEVGTKVTLIVSQGPRPQGPSGGDGSGGSGGSTPDPNDPGGSGGGGTPPEDDDDDADEESGGESGTSTGG